MTKRQVTNPPSLTGPLLPLLPPKPLNRQLPPLPARPHKTPLAPGWTCESFVLPAAFPRMFPDSTRKPGEPSRDPTSGSAARGGGGGKASDLKARFERLMEEQVEAFSRPVTLEDMDELDRQEQLVLVGNRYKPPPTPRKSAAGPGLTLVFSHANGFYKEVWEPVLADLVAELEQRDSALPVEEIWSLDCAVQGDAAVLNEDAIGNNFNWAENGRDLLNFIAYYLDSPDLSAAGPPSDSTSTLLLRPAADVPPEIGLVDNAGVTADPGSSDPLKRRYRDRLIVGIGHSLGACATVFAATAVPSLFSSLILVDPVLAPPRMADPKMTATVALGALRRRGVWESRKEAKEQFLSKPFFQAWDERILDGYVELGMQDLGEGRVALKTKPFYESITFLGSFCDTSSRATIRLSSLTSHLPLHYIFADVGRSMLPEPATTYLLEKATPNPASWTRVKGAGHLVSLEKPRETAKCLVECLERTYPKRVQVEGAASYSLQSTGARNQALTASGPLQLGDPFTGTPWGTAESSTIQAAPPPPAETSHGSARAAAPPPAASTSSATSSAPAPRLKPRDRLQWIEDKNGSVLTPAPTPTADVKGKGKERDDAPPPPPSSTASSSMAGLPGSRLVDDTTATPVESPSPFPTTTATTSTGQEIIIPAPVPGLPPLEAHQLPTRRVPFSTRRFVRDLEEAGIERSMAETVMRATRGLLTRQEGKAKRAILNRQDLENEAYLFQAALAELKTGSQVKLRNDSITLRSLTANLQRETDGLEQKMKEDMQRLGSDIQLEMNARKEETATELQSLDKRVMDLNSKFTILLSEVRTEIEATKWVSTRRVMTAITITVVLLVAYFSATKSSRSGDKSSSKNGSSGGHGGEGEGGKKKLPSIEDLGVQPTDAEAEALLGSLAVGAGEPRGGGGWSSFWGHQAQQPAYDVSGGKRIASEGEDEQ
ncbi:hypothetical protein JCM10908_000389 [Rhodotorula pacifica]|uniref:uncharacterized protein n=1 Tax=Rhodotorula pacifica TaxID=1495444 RepID=UPI00316EB1E2